MAEKAPSGYTGAGLTMSEVWYSFKVIGLLYVSSKRLISFLQFVIGSLPALEFCSFISNV